MRVLGLVPARGGSKGIPRKNVRRLGAKTLLQYTADAALAAQRLGRVVLSTDDEEIAALGRELGLEVPYLRPPELATDVAPMLPVVRHALEWADATGDRWDACCVLQPTAPFRRPGEVDACVELLERSGAHAVVTVRQVPPEHNPHWTYFRDSDGFLQLSTGEGEPVGRRQDLPPAFHRDGSVYVTRREVVLEQNSLYGKWLVGYVVDGPKRVNLDDPADWARAERQLGKGVR